MNCSSRGLRTASRFWRQSATRQPRRFASHEAGHGHGHDHGHGHGHGHGESALHLPGGSGNESFGLPFYLILATIPALYGVYTFTKSKDNAITRFLDRFQANPGAESAKNAAVSVVVQKALEDRSLFSNAETDYSVDLRFPEKFNVGSPINVAPGESRANLEELKAFYTKKYQEAEERRVARASGKDRPDTKEIEARLGRSN